MRPEVRFWVGNQERRAGARSSIGAILITLLLIAATPGGQTVRGRVVDARTGEGIASVGVMIMSGEDLLGTAITGPTGLFALTFRDAAGPLRLRVSREGYRSVTLDSIAVAPGQSIDVGDIRLEPAPVKRRETRAEATRSLPVGRANARNRLSAASAIFGRGKPAAELR